MSKRATHLPTSSPEGEAPDVDHLIDTLVRHGVEFLLIGGVATQTYGAIRPTTDFDCLVRRAGKNLEQLAAAMREFGARLRTSKHVVRAHVPYPRLPLNTRRPEGRSVAAAAARHPESPRPVRARRRADLVD